MSNGKKSTANLYGPSHSDTGQALASDWARAMNGKIIGISLAGQTHSDIPLRRGNFDLSPISATPVAVSEKR